MNINPQRMRKMALYLKYIAFLMEEDAKLAEKCAAKSKKKTRKRKASSNG